MKGLLVKDFRLMMIQKNFFLIILAIAIGMLMFTDDVSFPLGFMTFIISLFALSTISYDEFDNGNAFLFTLPISRTGYVVEKYSLGLILGFGTWLFALTVATITTFFKDTLAFSDLMMIALMILPLMLIIQSIIFPFQFKFGAEKGRIAMVGAFGVISIVGIAISKVSSEIFHISIADFINNLPTVSIGTIILIAIIISVVIFLISLKISVLIMNKKSF